MSLHLNRKKTSEQRQPRKRASASVHSAVSTATSSRSTASTATSKKPRKRSTASKKKSTPRRSLFRRTPLWVILSAVAAAVALYIFIFVRFFVDPFSFRWNAFYGEAVTPDGYDIRGIDISHYQDPIDWPRLRNADINGRPLRFVFVKATEGTDLIDENFNENFYQARQNDIIRGAYHFFSPLSDARKQARFFLKQVHLEPGDLPPVLDVEKADPLNPQQLHDAVLQWLQTVEAHYHVKPIIYTGYHFKLRYLSDPVFDQYPYWIAHYYVPQLEYKGPWSFWQYTDIGIVQGIPGHVDCNTFSGTLQELKALTIPQETIDEVGL